MLNILRKGSTQPDSKIIAILRLIRSENIGPKTFHNLVKYYGSPEVALENLPEFIKRSNSKIKIASKESALQEIEALDKIGAGLIAYTGSEYSYLLRTIDNFPPILSYKGDLSLMQKQCAAIVGARNCSISGKQIATKIAQELSYAGVVIVSGLARGIDTAAHIASKPNTISVIAGGIDNIYPPENHKLYQEISENGLLMAELPVGSVPMARHFPQRNRIISALSLATIVIEASLNSGSLITAQFALEQNREVFACPGFPLDPRCKGSNKLIKEGAQLLESSEDILSFINSESSILKDEISYIKTAPVYRHVDESLLNEQNRAIILSLLSAHPVTIEDIAEQSSLPYSIILTILLEYEIQERVASIGKNRFVLNF
ncbi:MAG: DNA-processing protein DprA [Rickettsiaceae bacterium]|nr:DNA-processing protein DprA [Rickettsiaceae bacterium]